MSTHYMTGHTGRVNAIITMADIYTYEGFVFEFSGLCGPMKLRKSHQPAAREGRKFHEMISRWCLLTDEEKAATRISG